MSWQVNVDADKIILRVRQEGYFIINEDGYIRRQMPRLPITIYLQLDVSTALTTGLEWGSDESSGGS